MARLNIELPERFLFSTELDVHAGHINGGGHLDNAQLLVLVSEARRRFFQHLGYGEADVEGHSTTVTDAAVVYRSEAFAGDVLIFRIAVRDPNKYGCDLVWQVTERTTGREVARGKTGFVFLQTGARTVAPVPRGFWDRTTARSP